MSNGDARAYPLRILIWHEIVNDVVDGVPVAITHAPLSNTALVFDRRVGDRVLEFGSTGKLRHSGLVMYDRMTESWWQQSSGEAIVGELTGMRLVTLLRGWSRGPDSGNVRPRGRSRSRPATHLRTVPIRTSMTTARRPRSVSRHAARGHRPARPRGAGRRRSVEPRSRSPEGAVRGGRSALYWEPGQASALDTGTIAEGRDVGNVLVERRSADGWQDAVYTIDVAFAFEAFFPNRVIHVR